MIDVTGVACEGLAPSCSDDAQQLSACAWVTARPEFDPDGSLSCIGQSPSAAQQAMRASGVGNHPAQRAAWPAARAATSESAARRRSQVIAVVRMQAVFHTVKRLDARAGAVHGRWLTDTNSE